jgi:hypothetical protein
MFIKVLDQKVHKDIYSVYSSPTSSKYTAYKWDASVSDLHVEAFAISRSPPVKENWKAGECIEKLMKSFEFQLGFFEKPEYLASQRTM